MVHDDVQVQARTDAHCRLSLREMIQEYTYHLAERKATMKDVVSQGERTLHSDCFRLNWAAKVLATVKTVSSSTPLPIAIWYFAHVCLTFTLRGLNETGLT
jgi:hypothetical protein